ncbi:MAG: tRNA 4-thiouridine(8) synthase ThiI [Lachnospiraceae bacterium]|nr:tRNA 4-thiouridine(8) synthase ThiI [Lachnospiraceae bacterium]
MEYSAFIVKYTEIALKGKNRGYFEKALVTQVRRQLDTCAGTFTVRHVNGRVYVGGEGFDFDETVSALQRVFGVNAICPAVTIARAEGRFLPRVEALADAAIRFIGEQYPEIADGSHRRTFKVKCRRVDKTYPLTSMECDAKIGEALLDAYDALKVDVHHPDILLHIELREQVNIYSETIEGPGGMPVGTSGKAMLLLSGGIDSPVAGYLIAKRGVTVDAVYFHAPPYTSERAKQKVVDLAGVIARYTGEVKLHVINFTDIQMYIYQTCPHDELTIIMRRYMMRIAEEIAYREGKHALVTGESVAQVASQTMQSLMVTDEVVTRMPVFRPVIAFDKQEIINISEKIGAFEISIQPYEDCCTIFVAKHPVTRPKPELIRQHEKQLAERIGELVDKALETDEVIRVIPQDTV